MLHRIPGWMTEVCPVCRTDAFLNPSIKFLLSPCYHTICDSCVHRLFSAGSAPCPICGATLRASSFTLPIFADPKVEKECRMRRQVLISLGDRQRADFVSANAYEDYLEEVEELVGRLVEDVDADSIQRRLDDIRRASRSNLTISTTSFSSSSITSSQSSVTPKLTRPTDEVLKIETELVAERKRRRVERERDLNSIASGRPFGELLKGLKSNVPIVKSPITKVDPLEGLVEPAKLFPFMFASPFNLDQEITAGGLTSSLYLNILFGITSWQLLNKALK